MKKEELRNLWHDRIIEFKQSGQTQVAFCSERGIQVKQLYYWLRKYKKEGNQKATLSGGWVSLDIKKPLEHKSNSSLDIKIGKAVIEVNSGFDRILLAEVLKTMSEIS